MVTLSCCTVDTTFLLPGKSKNQVELLSKVSQILNTSQSVSSDIQTSKSNMSNTTWSV